MIIRLCIGRVPVLELKFLLIHEANEICLKEERSKKKKANVGWFILPRCSVWNFLFQSIFGMTLSLTSYFLEKKSLLGDIGGCVLWGYLIERIEQTFEIFSKKHLKETFCLCL